MLTSFASFSLSLSLAVRISHRHHHAHESSTTDPQLTHIHMCLFSSSHDNTTENVCILLWAGEKRNQLLDSRVVRSLLEFFTFFFCILIFSVLFSAVVSFRLFPFASHSLPLVVCCWLNTTHEKREQRERIKLDYDGDVKVKFIVAFRRFRRWFLFCYCQ